MAKAGVTEKKEKTIIGIFNLENMTVTVDDSIIDIAESLADYDKMEIKIVCGNKKQGLEYSEGVQASEIESNEDNN